MADEHVDLNVLQQQLQKHRSSLADNIMSRLPERKGGATKTATFGQDTRRPATLGVGASASKGVAQYTSTDQQFRAKLGAKSGMKRAHEQVAHSAQDDAESEEEETRTSTALRKRPGKQPDAFAKAEAKIKAARDKASGSELPPHVASMSKAQRKKWNKRQRLEASKTKEGNKESQDGEKQASSLSPGASSSSISTSSSMTALQSSMLASLQGARFRSINERLYTHHSRDAFTFMQDEPQLFDEYHAGFRQQVRKWPRNPVDKIVELFVPGKKIKGGSYTLRAAQVLGALIVDVGAGEGGLAQKLVPHNFHALSYDLVDTPDGWVRGLDAAAIKALPLPGVDLPLGIVWQQDSQSIMAPTTVDVVVFCLSLMGTNWVDMVSEAWRVLKPGGEVIIAEVTSRLSATGNTKPCTDLICALGFHLDWTDTSNTHFVLFKFTKSVETRARDADLVDARDTLDWGSMSPAAMRRAVSSPVQASEARTALVQQGADVLKPCWYKRR